MQPHPAAPVLMHDLRRFQMQLVDGGHHDAVAGDFHLLQGAAHLLVGALCPGKLHDAGHQPGFIPDVQPGLLTEHLIKDLRLQLHAHPHTAGGKVCPCHRRALHSLAFQRRSVRSGGQILHAGHPLCQLHGGCVYLRLQPVPGFQHGHPAGQSKIQLLHRELVQHPPQDLPQHGGVQVHTAYRQHGAAVVPRHALSQLPGLRRVRVGAVEQDDIGLAQRFQFGDDPPFRLCVARPGDIADRAVGGDHYPDGGVLTDHLAGAGLCGKVKGHLLLEPRAFDHAGLCVLLVPHGTLHHVAHAVDQPHPARPAALQLQGHGGLRDEFWLSGHDGAPRCRLRQLVPGTFPGGGRAGHGGQHQLLHEPLDKGGFAAAHRAHHTDVDIPAGACADLATDAVLFLFLQGPSPLPVALRTAPVGVGVLVVSYEKGALIMPGRS